MDPRWRAVVARISEGLREQLTSRRAALARPIRLTMEANPVAPGLVSAQRAFVKILEGDAEAALDHMRLACWQSPVWARLEQPLRSAQNLALTWEQAVDWR
jgi:hypothetical protein